MINFIYGLPGTGKTTFISNKIKKDVENQKKALLIVTEQQTVEVETNMLKLLPPSAQLNFEVLNFSRLANKVFRLYGGLSYNYITDGMKNLFMKRTLIELAPLLNDYKLRNIGDTMMPSLMLAQINELKINGISATKLELVANKLEAGHPLRTKLSDIALIYQTFEGMIKNAYDDSSNDLEKLYKLLCKHDFFNSYNVYIDGFSSFTTYEYKIIERIFNQADNCFVTLPLPDRFCNEIHLSSVNDASNKLCSLVGNDVNIIKLVTPYRAANDEAKRILTSLWNFTIDTKSLPPVTTSDFITITACDDKYCEAEAVANTVLQLLQKGYRRRDIAVIAGDINSYRGIIDSTFEKAHIPYFMSDRTELLSEPLISFILSALDIKLKNWRTSDVITYLKTGLTDILTDDADVFEIYVSTWKISGTHFLDEYWSMNPDGYTSEISQRGLKIIETANDVKNKLTAPLIKFFTMLDASKNVTELCNTTYEFFKAMNLSEKLSSQAQKAFSQNDRKSTLEFVGTHKAFIKVLSDISSSMGAIEMTVEEFASSLKLVFGNTKVNTIPTAADEVILGSASTLRTSNIRCAILIGMCDGEFPAQVSEKGLFSDSEKNILKDFEIEISGDTVSRNSEELLYSYRAMTLPSDKLFMFYHRSSAGNSCKPSLAIKRTLALLPHLTINDYNTTDEIERLISKELSFELIRKMSPKTQAALKEIFKDDPVYTEFLNQLNIPISDTKCFITEETADDLFGNRLYMTQSRLEKYIKCHFLYYCQYVLKLRETEVANFNFANTGSFIHRILECFMRQVVDENGLKKELLPDEISYAISLETERYIVELFRDKVPPSKRLLHHFERLKKLALLVASDLYNEICESDFTPKFFELSIGRGKDPKLPPYEISLKDGSTILLNGVVDRVDIFKKNNEVYIKIVDYKTGSKKFSMSDIEKGLNTQMLLYLFAICNTNSSSFKEELGCNNGDTLKPASVMYVSTLVSPTNTSISSSQTEIMATASEQIIRDGLILNDPEIIKALNQNNSSKYLANIKLASTGEYKGKALVTYDDFAAIEDFINQTLSDISKELRGGNASAEPLKVGNTFPCDYCKMKQFCRINKEKSSDDANESETEE